MNTVTWGRISKFWDKKTVLDRQQVGEFTRAINEFSDNWSKLVADMQIKVSQGTSGKNEAATRLDDFLGDSLGDNFLYKALKVYEEPLGLRKHRSTNGKEYSCFRFSKLKMVGLFGDYKPWEMPPRDRLAISITHEGGKYFEKLSGKNRMEFSEKVLKANEVVLDLRDNVVPMLESARNKTDLDEAALSKTSNLLKHVASSLNSQQAPVSPAQSATAVSPDTEPQHTAESRIGDQLRRVRGTNPNMKPDVGGSIRDGIRKMFEMSRV